MNGRQLHKETVLNCIFTVIRVCRINVLLVKPKLTQSVRLKTVFLCQSGIPREPILLKLAHLGMVWREAFKETTKT